MKGFRFAVISMVVISVGSAAAAPLAHAEQGYDRTHLDFGRSDHQLHFAVGTAGTVAGSLLFQRLGVFGAPIASGLVMLFAAYTKEVIDPVYSSADLQAGAAGIGSGMVFSFAF